MCTVQLSTPPKKILIIRPSALGDVCRTVPVIAALKQTYLDAAIDWIVQDSFVDAVSAHPAVRRVIPFPRKRFSKWWTPSVGREVLAWLSALRGERYDIVLDCQGLARSGLFAWWTRSPVRIGYKQAAEGAWLALTRRVDAPMTLHTVDRMMLLAKAAGAGQDPECDMRLYAPAEAWNTIRDGLDADKVINGRYILIAPTSRWPGKLWPAERYVQVVQALLDDPNLAFDGVCIVGSEHERSQCSALLEMSKGTPRVVDAIGKTSIASLMALVERAALVIGSDSACIHMAVGFNRPLVALYGPTDVTKVGPYRHDESVVQKLVPGDRFDHKDEAHGKAMMDRISASDVVEKAVEVMGRSN